MAESSEEPDVKRRKLTASSRGTSVSTRTETNTSTSCYIHQPLQSDINIVEFAECRARELIAMRKISRFASGNKLPQQVMPRHMRRRAASHNIKRLPRRLRQAAMWENLQNPRGQTKRPSRKHRRRPSNLLNEYLHRQRKKKWLETHIWHAKRFHMTEKWGYRLPLHPNDKGARASYRASVKHCLLQDLSFLTCIEIRGDQASVTERLNRLTSKDVGLRFGAAAYRKGQREGSIVVYEADMYPYAAIGPVQFMWKPRVLAQADAVESVLWIWAHPAILNILLKNILTVLDISPITVDVNTNKQKASSTDAGNQESTTCSDGNASQTNADNVSKANAGASNCDTMKNLDQATRQTQIPPKTNDKHEKITKMTDASEKEKDDEATTSCDFIGTVFTSDNFSVKLLNNELCRFQLTGPLSQAVLAQTLEIANVTCSSFVNGATDDADEKSSQLKDNTVCKKQENIKNVSSDDATKKLKSSKNHLEPLVDSSIKTKPSEGTKWWKTHYEEDAASEILTQQSNMWCLLAGVQSPSELLPHSVLGLTVADPRLQLPAKRRKTYPDIEDWNTESTEDKINWTPDVSYSPLWEEDIRKEVMETKKSEQEINTLRSKLLVPGSKLELGDEASRIPVILLQHPGNQPLGGAGGGRMGLGCGWDIILPARWAMAFWIPLVYRGARVCGLRDTSALCSSQGVLHFPSYYPDTTAGQRHQNDVTTEQVIKHRKRPPSKRTNHFKYGVVAPFEPPWKELVANWCNRENKASSTHTAKQDIGESEDKSKQEPSFYVLRSGRILGALGNLCYSEVRKGAVAVSESKLAASVLSDERYRNALVPIQVEMVTKGTPGAMAMICVPTEQDLKDVQGKKDWDTPEEPKHKVPKLSKKAKTKAKTKELKAKFAEKLEEKRKKEVKTVRSSCSREIAGFVCCGGFDLPSGYGSGVGFITLPALQTLLSHRDEGAKSSKSQGSTQKTLVLVRNKSSLKYRYASLSIFQSSIKLC